MVPSVPADDSERVHLSEDHVPFFYGIVFPSVVGCGSVIMGTWVLNAGGDAALGVMLVALPLLVALLWWRWGTRLFRVAATCTGFLVWSKRSEWFVPYAVVASTRWGHDRGSRIVVVELRQAVAGLRRFAFVASRSGMGHTTLSQLGRWPDAAHGVMRCDECGSPMIPRASTVARLCAECAHLLYGLPGCSHEFGPRGSCVLCGWDRSRSDHTRELAQPGKATEAWASARDRLV